MTDKFIHGIVAMSLLLNLWLSFLLGRWFFANIQASLHVNALNSEKPLRLQGGGRFVQAFSNCDNESEVAVVMKMAGGSLLWANMLSKHGSKQTLQSGMLEIEWVVDAEGLHELRILDAGKAVNLP